MVKQKIGSKSGIIFCDLPDDDPKKRCPDISLANEILDWALKIQLSKGLDYTIEWYARILHNKDFKKMIHVISFNQYNPNAVGGISSYTQRLNLELGKCKEIFLKNYFYKDFFQ